MHINIKAPKGFVFLEPSEAIEEVIARQIWSKGWDTGGASFGQTMSERREIDGAIKTKNHSAFRASKRRGYWRVELNQP